MKEITEMTMGELKVRKAELRNKMDAERKTRKGITIKTFFEYRDVFWALVNTESQLLKPIVMSIVLALILAISGCYSIHGIGKDLSTWSSPYIENTEK